MKRIIKPSKVSASGAGGQAQDKASGQASGVSQRSTPVLEKRPLAPKEIRQNQFLKAYTANNFNISEACRTIGVDRKTFYNWKKLDPSFCEDLRASQDALKDYLKSKLLKLVDEGNLIATIFACKSLGGMVESTKQEISISKAPVFDQDQLDAMVRLGSPDRKKYNQILGLD